MELGTFVMCQISKMHFSHAFPHSWKTLSHKTLLKIYSLIHPTFNPLQISHGNELTAQPSEEFGSADSKRVARH